jgi:hypothetical protein
LGFGYKHPRDRKSGYDPRELSGNLLFSTWFRDFIAEQRTSSAGFLAPKFLSAGTKLLGPLNEPAAFFHNFFLRSITVMAGDFAQQDGSLSFIAA